MKNIGKSIIVLGMLATTMGIGEFILNNKTYAIEDREQKVIKEYKSNILDDIYTLNGEIVLPFIFDDADKTILELFI